MSTFQRHSPRPHMPNLVFKSLVYKFKSKITKEKRFKSVESTIKFIFEIKAFIIPITFYSWSVHNCSLSYDSLLNHLNWETCEVA